jgi:AcrR family transcriptional regulator
VERFIEAALELMESSAGKDFTVQQVVEQSGQSLRSFYQYFDGKHELLLALFEESIRTTAEQLRAGFADEKDAGERLHRFVVDYYRVCRPAKAKGDTKKLVASPALVDFAQQLLTEHPAEAARAFRPLVALFDEVLDDAAAAGAIRSGLNRRRIAGVVLESIMFNAFSFTIAGASVSSNGTDDAEELWDFVLNGLGAGSSKKK